MKLKIFSIYDTKALSYGVPFFMQTTASAVREYGDLVNDERSSIHKHPSDYVLFQIGEYDDGTGVVVSVSPYSNLGLGSDFVPANPARDITVIEGSDVAELRKEVVKGGKH